VSAVLRTCTYHKEEYVSFDVAVQKRLRRLQTRSRKNNVLAYELKKHYWDHTTKAKTYLDEKRHDSVLILSSFRLNITFKQWLDKRVFSFIVCQ